MANIDTVPLEIARMIAAELTTERTPTLTALSRVNRASRKRYQVILFENVAASRPSHFLSLARAFLNPTLAAAVRHADLHPRGLFVEWSIVLNLEIIAAVRSQAIWSRPWEESLYGWAPHAWCGLLLAMMPYLVTLRITTTIIHSDFPYNKIPRITISAQSTLDSLGASNPVHFTSAIRSDHLILASSFYGPLGERYPDKFPRPQNLHSLVLQGQMPEFVLSLPDLRTISFNLKLVDEHETKYSDPLIPSRAPVYDTVTSVTIRLDKKAGSFRALRGDIKIAPYMTRFIGKLKNLRQVQLLFESVEKSDIHFPAFIRNDHRTWIPRSTPYKILKSYAQLIINSRPAVTHHATIPESIIVALVFWASQEMDDTSWFPPLHSLTICSASQETGYILEHLLRRRESCFSCLTLLTIQYKKDSKLLDEQATGSIAVFRVEHQNLCMSIEQCGIDVVREYESDEAHS